MFFEIFSENFFAELKRVRQKTTPGGVVLKLALGNYIINEKHEKVGYKLLTNRKILDVNFINMEEDYS